MTSPRRLDVYRGLRALVEEIFPDSTVESVRPMSGGEKSDRPTEKGVGYGETLRVLLHDADGARRELVFHTATDNDFGHDRRADRAESMLLDYDTFGAIPSHARAVDVGAVCEDGSLRSVAGCGEFYLLTEYAEGAPYADDLRRIVDEGRLEDRDRERCAALARYLADLHRRRPEGRPARYTRSIRDLVGDGEGIFGIVDGFPPDVPAAPQGRLKEIESRCVEWRWRLRGKEERLATIHGDFHPFNVLFAEDARPSLLDASRGCAGDPADDVTCMAVNYVFFALERPETWRAFGELWDQFWERYLALTGDLELFEAAPPYWAWRTLVLCNPVWYPALGAGERDALLSFAEEVLAEGRLEPERAGTLFA